jgi:hypothetical protein
MYVYMYNEWVRWSAIATFFIGIVIDSFFLLLSSNFELASFTINLASSMIVCLASREVHGQSVQCQRKSVNSMNRCKFFEKNRRHHARD